MKRVLASVLIASFMLTGCASWFRKDESVKTEAVVAKETKYVIKVPPAQLMTLPPAPAKIDVDNAKQSDIAKWIIAKEDYTTQLETLLKGIAIFFTVEQAKLDEQARKENVDAKAKAADAQVKSAIDAANKPVAGASAPTK